jgi:hypothetical protein
MGIRKKLAAIGVGAALAVGAMAVPAQAAPSESSGGVAPHVAVQASTAVDAATAAPRWQYTGARYYWAIECNWDANELTYATGWPTQCRGPHTDGYYYLWAYH